MLPLKQVKMLTSEDYEKLRDLLKIRKLPAGKVKRARIVLLSNQGYAGYETVRRCSGDAVSCRNRWQANAAFEKQNSEGWIPT